MANRGQKAVITFRVTMEVLDWLDSKATESQRSRSWVVNDCIKKIKEKKSDEKN